MLGLCVIALTARLLDPDRAVFASAMFCLSAVGQGLTWRGLNCVRHRSGWDSGVLFPVWVGGILGAMAVLSTGVVTVVPIPLVAPLVATFARWRLRRVGKATP